MTEPTTHPDHPLATEIATYNRRLPELGAEAGRFIVLKGEETVGIFDSYGEAVEAGFKRFTLEPFVVKEILPAEGAWHPADGCGCGCH